MPLPVPGLGGITAVAAGGQHTCALDAAGSAHCWGGNIDGELGATGPFMMATPTTIAGPIVAIAAGSDHTCLLSADGSMRCTGSNQYGQLGSAMPFMSYTPLLVAGVPPASAIAAGGDASYALVVGRAWGFGSNASGQLAAAPADVVAPSLLPFE
jgi:alpha-tubulin suppressor-like RCC1 family protein